MEALAESLARGATLFNAGEFFAAHEAWEEGWRAAQEPAARTLLQGLIQVAAGFYKAVEQGKPESARRLLTRGLAKLDAVGEAPGLDLPGLREATRRCERALTLGGLDRRSIPAIALRG